MEILGQDRSNCAHSCVVPSPVTLRCLVALLGVLLCRAFQVDLLAVLGLNSGWPFVGYIATGLLVGRGLGPQLRISGLPWQ